MGDEPSVGLSFTVEVDAPSDLAFDATRADALITVKALAAGGTRPVPAAEILIMDRSLSMAGRGKLDEAKRAMCAAVDALRDGTRLAIIAGNHTARVVYPPTGTLAGIDAGTRAAAKLQIARQLPEGGTAIGSWLTLAGQVFETLPDSGTVRHAVLYTDGKDEHETPEELGTALAACSDRFVCDARGLGDDWNYAELLRITEALHGTAEAVVTISDLTGDFTRLIRQARRIVLPRVYLGLRLNDRFRLDSVRQTRPVDAGLTGSQRQSDGELHVPLGAWSPETRQYEVSLSFDAESLPVDEDLRAARITLHAERPDGTRQPCAGTMAMVVRRRSTPGFETMRPSELTRVESRRELGMAMRACADAWDEGDLARADRELRLAVEVAESLQDTARLRVLRAVAETGPDGRPRLRRTASRGEMQRLGLESTRTAAPRVDPVGPWGPVGAGERGEWGDHPAADGTPQRRCPRCGATTAARLLRHCEACGYGFDDAGEGAGEGAAAGGARGPAGGPADGLAEGPAADPVRSADGPVDAS
ncbi:vWA domain-containing protein [Streptomyces sp. NBC_01190]|uniref:vWA domain-containing protein n=1 Tax=Streptomyces sp. NBC_01190 TaxID=2903767 RepID=UPI00386DD381|nr:VWA domain-containing protein [Streptomyces sp. NBC_01190]